MNTMNTENNFADDDDKYQVISVEKTEPPKGMPTGSWYRYILGQGTSKIEGIKLGTLQAVKQHAQEMASDISSRAKRSGSFYAPRGRK